MFVGCDHAAVSAKQEVLSVLARHPVEIIDLGTHDEESVDYPDYALRVARAVAKASDARGILLCGTGIGMSIAANKVPGVRAALVSDEHTARMSRLHNDANILVIGGRVTPQASVAGIVEVWLSADFEGGRHSRRVDKITAAETGNDDKETDE